jgi:hypothetical protein
LTLSVLLVLPSPTALALSGIPEETGWSGYVLVGAGYTSVKSNTVVGNDIIDVGDDTISSIDRSPDSESVSHLLAGLELRYTLSNRNQIFLGASLEDRLTLDFATQLGWRKQTEASGTFQVSYLFSGVPMEVWRDPYLTGTERKATDRDSDGLRFVWGEMLGSAFELTLQARTNDIDEEESGSALNSSCDLACQSLLDRNGDQYQARLSYTIMRPGGHIFRPQLRLRREDRNGKAIARDAWDIQLSYSYIQPEWLIVLNGVYGQSNYDEASPLYGRRQDADTLSLDASFLYTLPTESRRWQFTTGVFWAESDSDIRFHDNGLKQVSVGLLYNLGNYGPSN